MLGTMRSAVHATSGGDLSIIHACLDGWLARGASAPSSKMRGLAPLRVLRRCKQEACHLVIKMEVSVEIVCAVVRRAAGVLLEHYSAMWPVRCGLIFLPPDTVQRVKQSCASNAPSGADTPYGDALPSILVVAQRTRFLVAYILTYNRQSSLADFFFCRLMTNCKTP